MSMILTDMTAERDLVLVVGYGPLSMGSSDADSRLSRR